MLIELKNGYSKSNAQSENTSPTCHLRQLSQRLIVALGVIENDSRTPSGVVARRDPPKHYPRE
jgi:hypothetical protein